MFDTASDTLKSAQLVGQMRFGVGPMDACASFDPEFDDIIELDTDVGDAGVSVCWGDELIELENDCVLLVVVVVVTIGALYVHTIRSRSLELCVLSESSRVSSRVFRDELTSSSTSIGTIESIISR